MDTLSKLPPVLSHFQITPILAARKKGSLTAITSTDLGLTEVEVRLEPGGVILPDGARLTWDVLEEIAANPLGCYSIEEGAPQMVRGFSELSGLYYSLMPTPSAPTMLISGLPMHRIKDTDPYEDTLTKIRAVSPVRGRVLDTATGLGYTAIHAARTASQVVTIEIDPQAQEIARRNPWSQALFGDPKITRLIGDSYDEIESFPAESFACIIHDPPTLRLAGDLYSAEFYFRAFRVLKPDGRMFHYIGDPRSKSGASVTKGVVRRLKQAGFTRVLPRPEAFGVVAYK